jgi:hypothetical protein
VVGLPGGDLQRRQSLGRPVRQSFGRPVVVMVVFMLVSRGVLDAG